MLSDGVADYTWDAENRLVRIETNALAVSNYGFPHRLIEFKYDYQGRRVQKRVVDVDQNTELYSRRYLYDGWNVIAEYLAPGGTTLGALVRSYTWGLDITADLANAGGVGALLQIADHPTGKTFLPTYDGNGNVAALINAATGALAAVYEYSPFGEPLRAQTYDTTIADNPWRFSTKWTDLEIGLLYYGHRYYNPRDGRFINRDPIEEAGGLNLYGFVGNNSINQWDVLGRHDYQSQCDESVAYYEAIMRERALTDEEQQLYSYWQSEGGRVNAYETSVNGASADDPFVNGALDAMLANISFSMSLAGDLLSGDGGADQRDMARLQAVQTRLNNGESVSVRGANGAIITFNPGDRILTYTGSQGTSVMGVSAPNSVTLGSGSAKTPTSGSGWGSVMVVYEGAEKADPNNKAHATGAQLGRLATNTVGDPKYAINAQSAVLASAIALENGIGTHSVKYVVVLDHGDSNWYGGMRQQLGDKLLSKSDMSFLSVFVQPGGAVVLYGCSAGDSTGYLQNMTNAAGTRVYAFPFDVQLKPGDPLPSPAPDWPYKDPVRKGP